MDELLRYLDSIRGRTIRVGECVPADRMEWAPAGGAMSFGDLLRHIAVTGRWMFIETALGRPSQYTTHGPEIAATKDEILQLLMNLHREGLACLSAIDAAGLEEKVQTPAGAWLSRGKWLRAMVEHEVHHRGQLYLMLRMCRVPTPPMFGLTSEQLRERAGEDRTVTRSDA